MGLHAVVHAGVQQCIRSAVRAMPGAVSGVKSESGRVIKQKAGGGCGPCGWAAAP
jgi:hypothetical protein